MEFVNILGWLRYLLSRFCEYVLGGNLVRNKRPPTAHPRTFLLQCIALYTTPDSIHNAKKNMSGDNKRVVLIADGNERIETRLGKCSLSGMITDLAEGHTDITLEVPLPQVRAHVASTVVRYLEHHHDNRAPELERPLTRKLQEVLSDWDMRFIETNYSHTILFEIIQAATVLNIRDLIELCSAVIADMMKMKSVEDIREMFGIVSDFTPEEAEALRREYEASA